MFPHSALSGLGSEVDSVLAGVFWTIPHIFMMNVDALLRSILAHRQSTVTFGRISHIFFTGVDSDPVHELSV